MSFIVNTKERSTEVEIMDNLDLSGPLLIKTLDQIAGINRWLGGNRVTLDGIKKLVKNHPKEKTISIVDLGCGNGDLLREVAAFGRKKGYQFQLIGIDANQTTVNYAIALSKNYQEISYQKLDVLSEDFKTKQYDIALCTLFLHHFKNNVAIHLIQSLMNNVRIGFVVNDLHRSPLAYYLFKLLTVFIRNEMARTDGAISILRGFKKRDLVSFSKKLKYPSVIKWKWAFRYQWIIKKT